MKNRIFKAFTISLVAIIIFATLCVFSFAAEETANIFNLTEKSHMMVTVEYTKSAPNIKFVSPGGTEYGSEAFANGTIIKETGDSALTFRIRNAEAGQWKIVYDKGSNPKLNITWAPYGEAISINELSVSKESDTKLKVSILTSYFEDTEYDYSLYAVTTDENGYVTGKLLISNGRLRTNTQETVGVSISELATYSSYKVMAEASLKVGSVTVSDSKVSEGNFAYTNANAPEALENLKIEVGVNEEYLYLNWEDYKKHCDSYLVAVYTNGNGEAIYANEFDNDITSTEILIDPSATSYKIDIGYKSTSGEISNYLSRTVEMKYAKAITTDATEETGSSYVKIDYDFTSFPEKTVKTEVTVNENTQEVMLSGKDTMSAALELFENELSIRWYINETTSYLLHYSIYSDNQAPILVLPEITASVNTKEAKYILVGYTNPGCTVTVNSETATVDANGNFTVTLNLEKGENEFVVIAKNGLGISSSQTFTVNRSAFGVAAKADNTEVKASSPFTKFLKEYSVLIITFAASLLLLLHILLSRKIFINRRRSKGVFCAIITVMGTTLCYASILLGGYAGYNIFRFIESRKTLYSMDFYNMANKAISESYTLIETNQLIKKQMIVSIIVFSVVLLAALALLILSTLMKKKAPKPKAPESKKPEVKAEPEKKVTAKPEVKAEPEKKIPTPEVKEKNAEEAVKKEKATFCPKCGTENVASASFCKKCGNVLKSTEK